MRIQQLTCPRRIESSALSREDHVHFLRAKVWCLALCIACELQSSVDGEASRIAEWFFPELGGSCDALLKAELKRMVSGERYEVGEVDLTGFVAANPGLAGYVSPVAHGLFKLMVGIMHCEHAAITFSSGDCSDLAVLFEYCEPALQSAGFSGRSGAAGDLKAFSECVGQALSAGHSLKLSSG